MCGGWAGWGGVGGIAVCKTPQHTGPLLVAPGTLGKWSQVMVVGGYPKSYASNDQHNMVIFDILIQGCA